MPLYKEQGIVLRSVKLGEADKIVTILTQGSGKVRTVAKGIRRTQSKFGARLEPFTHVSLLMYRGRNLDTVTQAEIISPFLRVRGEFDLIAAGEPMLAAGDMTPALDLRREARAMLYRFAEYHLERRMRSFTLLARQPNPVLTP